MSIFVGVDESVENLTPRFDMGVSDLEESVFGFA